MMPSNIDNVVVEGFRGGSPYIRNYHINGTGTTDVTALWNLLFTSLTDDARVSCPPGAKYRIATDTALAPTTLKGISVLGHRTYFFTTTAYRQNAMFAFEDCHDWLLRGVNLRGYRQVVEGPMDFATVTGTPSAALTVAGATETHTTTNNQNGQAGEPFDGGAGATFVTDGVKVNMVAYIKSAMSGLISDVTERLITVDSRGLNGSIEDNIDIGDSLVVYRGMELDAQYEEIRGQYRFMGRCLYEQDTAVFTRDDQIRADVVLFANAAVTDDVVIQLKDALGNVWATKTVSTTVTTAATAQTFSIVADTRGRDLGIPIAVHVRKATITANTITVLATIRYGDVLYSNGVEQAAGFKWLRGANPGLRCTDMTFEYCEAEGFGGDGWQASTADPWGVYLDHCLSRANSRQGMSFNGGRDIEMRHTKIWESGRSNLDYEVAGVGGWVSNPYVMSTHIVYKPKIEGCDFRNPNIGFIACAAAVMEQITIEGLTLSAFNDTSGLFSGPSAAVMNGSPFGGTIHNVRVIRRYPGTYIDIDAGNPEAAGGLLISKLNYNVDKNLRTNPYEWLLSGSGTSNYYALVTPTTLAAAAAAGDTTLTLTNTTGHGTYGIGILESEQFSWTNKTATTLTGVTRGVNGTTAASHANGTKVYHNPYIDQPDAIYLNGVKATAGTLGALTATQWAYGDSDRLGFKTVYVRLTDSADPDSKADGWVKEVRGILTLTSATQTAADSTTTFTDSNAKFVNDGVLVGMKVTNRTDNSTGFITAKTATTLTVTLTGGSDNTFQTNDIITIGRMGGTDLTITDCVLTGQITIGGGRNYMNGLRVETTSLETTYKDNGDSNHWGPAIFAEQPGGQFPGGAVFVSEIDTSAATNPYVEGFHGLIHRLAPNSFPAPTRFSPHYAGGQRLWKEPLLDVRGIAGGTTPINNLGGVVTPANAATSVAVTFPTKAFGQIGTTVTLAAQAGGALAAGTLNYVVGAHNFFGGIPLAGMLAAPGSVVVALNDKVKIRTATHIDITNGYYVPGIVIYRRVGAVGAFTHRYEVKPTASPKVFAGIQYNIHDWYDLGTTLEPTMASNEPGWPSSIAVETPVVAPETWNPPVDTSGFEVDTSFYPRTGYTSFNMGTKPWFTAIWRGGFTINWLTAAPTGAEVIEWEVRRYN